MNYNQFHNINYYNLFVSADSTAWESNSFIMSIERCLTSFTDTDIKKKFDIKNDDILTQIKKFPCLFLYEEGVNDHGYIGYLTSIKIRHNGIKFNFKIIEKILLEEVKALYFELAISMNKGITELMHTHWTIKNVNLFEELYDSRTSISESSINKPTVFISYSWSSVKTRKRVEALVSKLRNDNIIVKYDKNSVLPGNDLNYFMESLKNDSTIQKVLVICDKSYTDKANNRSGGVGTETEIIIPDVYGNPMQNKIIPILFEKDENHQPIVPIYLRGKFGIDFTEQNQERGYADLLEDVFR